ncbi:GNAT family N-acetyltransferase [Streptomyces rishiriensis]|uniref:RimJ/RimL family protein N-acetyltransferase n=1 Tax=Streptomyces rishiriensis TaxID=68264 RepID=A0ABU0NJ29_STRRH|nr:GNAT family N-acetyltransferase [Streptomyces rishiriensis]MDQ0579119.1 RimJ/RimL family protein N-acetyltransferase [Streptomyces rishiriensis]
METKGSFVVPTAPLRLEGAGIVLREWTEDDVDALVEMYDDPEIARWTPVVSPFDSGAARAYLDKARTSRAEGRTAQLAVTTDGGRPRGEVLLFRSGSDERDAELAYGVGAEHRGQGLAARAVRLVTELTLRELRPRRLVLCIEHGNTASEAVAHACGFTLTDELPVTRQAKGREVLLRTWSLRPENADRG